MEREVGRGDREQAHVLHVIDSLGAAGGAERGFVRELVRFHRVRSTVVVLQDNVPLRDELVAAGIEVVELGHPAGTSALRMLPRACWQVAAVARRVRPDVIHTSLFHADVAGAVAALAVRRPLLASLVSSGDRYQTDAAPGAPRRRRAMVSLRTGLARLAGARYRALTAYTAASNAAVLGLDPDRISVVPRGVDLARFTPDGPVDRGTGGAPRIVNVGRHEAQKAQRDLIDAVALLHRDQPGTRLAIIGLPGTATGDLCRRIAELGLGDVVDLADAVDDVAPLLRGADAFVLSSREEGLGTALVEALAVGCPAVAVDIGPVREITDDGRLARLVPPGDPAALAAALAEVAAAPDDPAAAAARRAWVVEHHDGDAVAVALEDLLEATAQAGPARRRSGAT